MKNRRMGLLGIGLLLILLTHACACAEREPETVRVGFFAFDGYHMIDEDGNKSGYGYEFLQHLVGYTDWKLEYVGYDKSWSEMQDMLEAGEIDLLTSAQKTAERLERFDFSAEPIGTSCAILTVQAGNTRYLAGDYANWNGMRVGMLEGNSRNDAFMRLAGERGFTYAPVFFSDIAQLTRALKSDAQIDAILTSDLRSIRDEWVLERFDPSPFYIMVAKGNARLRAQTDEAMACLYADETDLRAQLADKYYLPASGEEIPFTAEERAFIEEMREKQFTAIVNPDREPFSWYRDGEPRGIISDIARKAIARSGLNIRFVETRDRAAYAALVRSGTIDIRFDAMADYARSEALGYRLTTPYLDIEICALYKKDATRFETAALVRDSDIANKYARYFESRYENILYCDGVAQAVEAVLSGRADAAYLYRRTAALAAHNDIANRLAVRELYGFETSFAAAVSDKDSHLLYSIVKRCLASIGTSEIRLIDQAYTSYSDKPYSPLRYIYEHPIAALGIVLAFGAMLAITGFAVYQVRKRRRDEQRLRQEQRRAALLSDALAAAENAGTAKSQFLSRVSHEMRTPLNAIIGFMSLAQGADVEQVRTYLANSELAARQLLSVINDVLDMSSIEAGKLKLAHSLFDFRQLLRSVTNVFLAQCAQKGLQFETRFISPVEEWLIGDQLRVNQILNNLLSNAVKFTTSGHVWLTVSEAQAQGKTVIVRFEVSDTGCGMNEDMKARLFKPFEQESASTAMQYGGSGLGLSIVKSIVGMMNGTVLVESEQNVGTTFTVDLPFEKSDVKTYWKTPPSMENLRVLVVDDEAREREYIDAILTRIHVEHTCAAGGDEALAALAQSEREGKLYNVCFVDWRMPHMNGMETTRRIRARYGDNTVVIVVSAYEQYQASESAREAGANLFVAKPLFQSSVWDMLMTLTGGHITDNEESPKASFAGKRVLLVEDNAMNRIVARGLLQKLDLSCDEAADGRIATDMFIASAPGYYDAILMDIQMPNMNGYEAAKAIRASAHPDAARVQIIALTANAFNEDIAKALSMGMNAHVSKPIEPQQLVATLVRAFRAGNKGGGA